MENWRDFILLTTIAYLGLLAIVSFICLPKMRKNLAAYLCFGQTKPDQEGELSDTDREKIAQARKQAEERKMEECAICLEEMG